MLRLETDPAPAICMAVDLATKRVLRVNVADFDPAVYAAVEQRGVGVVAAYEAEPVE